MVNKTLEDIKKYAINRLKEDYGYCGLADSPNASYLNSGGDGENITIIIKHEKEVS
jgi:hypothetical protein